MKQDALSNRSQSANQSAVSASSPLVSVVIPAYNAERFLARTLQSVLTQTYRYLEVLVVDDGSQDATWAIVAQLAQQDARLRLLSQSNRGVAAARNLAIQHAQGDLIAPIDADDLWSATHLSQLVECLVTSPDTVGLAYSWSINIDEKDQPLAGFHAAKITGAVYPTLLCHNFLGNASCTLIRRSVLEQVGLYSEQFQSQNAPGCEDWDLYLRIAAVCAFGVVPTFSVGYRKVSYSMSCNYERMGKSHALMLQSVSQIAPNLPTSLFQLSRSSLYLYFANQCSMSRADRTALYWLWQAIRADRSPLIRISTYRLVLKYCVMLMAQLATRLDFLHKTRTFIGWKLELNRQSVQRHNENYYLGQFAQADFVCTAANSLRRDTHAENYAENRLNCSTIVQIPVAQSWQLRSSHLSARRVELKLFLGNLLHYRLSRFASLYSEIENV